jgi:RNA recognition motif-containing protein
MGTKLYVGNLNSATTENALRAAFNAGGGNVRDVAIPNDRETGRPRGFGFVTMGTEAEAQAAVTAMNGKSLDGNSLKVNEARERTARLND